MRSVASCCDVQVGWLDPRAMLKYWVLHEIATVSLHASTAFGGAERVLALRHYYRFEEAFETRDVEPGFTLRCAGAAGPDVSGTVSSRVSFPPDRSFPCPQERSDRASYTTVGDCRPQRGTESTCNAKNNDRIQRLRGIVYIVGAPTELLASTCPRTSLASLPSRRTAATETPPTSSNMQPRGIFGTGAGDVRTGTFDWLRCVFRHDLRESIIIMLSRVHGDPKC